MSFLRALPLALALPVMPLQAATVAYDVPAGTAGNQAYNLRLAMLFDVNKPIRVGQIGAFDDGSDGIQSGTITTEIWSRTGGGTGPGDLASGVTQLAFETFTPNDPGTLIGGSRFKDLSAPIVLSPGEYAVVSFGYDSDDRNGNRGSAPLAPWSTNDGGGAIEFVGLSQFDRASTPGSPALGDTVDGGPADRYAAGTFSYSVVPVPAALPLMLGGLALMAGLARRGGRRD